MYNLPKFERTFVRTINGEGEPWTYLFTRRNGEDFWISRFPYTIGHKDAFRRHTTATRRFMWLQRIWRIGRHFKWSRVRILRAFHV